MLEIQAFKTFQGIGCLISTNRNCPWAGASPAPCDDCHYKSNRPKVIMKTEDYNNCVFHQTFGQWSFRTNCWLRYIKLGCFFTWSSVLLKLSTCVEITRYASSTNKWDGHQKIIWQKVTEVSKYKRTMTTSI